MFLNDFWWFWIILSDVRNIFGLLDNSGMIAILKSLKIIEHLRKIVQKSCENFQKLFKNHIIIIYFVESPRR